MSANIQIADLPVWLQVWVDLIGLDAVWKLVERYGGTPLYVPTPERLNADHDLSRLLGYEPAKRICEQVQHGDYVLVPCCTQAVREICRKQMLEDLRHDSVDTVALRYGVHRRTVFRLLADRAGTDEPQGDLFET